MWGVLGWAPLCGRLWCRETSLLCSSSRGLSRGNSSCERHLPVLPPSSCSCLGVRAVLRVQPAALYGMQRKYFHASALL